MLSGLFATSVFFIFLIFEYAESNIFIPLKTSFSPGRTLVWYIFKTSSAMSRLIYFLCFVTFVVWADAKSEFSILVSDCCEASEMFVREVEEYSPFESL